MSEQTEAAMIQAITAHLIDENPTGQMTRLRGIKIMAVTDNGDHPSGQRLMYLAADSFDAHFILAAPDHTIGTADAPILRNRRL